MTNKEKIEAWIASNENIVNSIFISEVDSNFFMYELEFISSSEHITATYDISVNEDDTINFITHLRIGY